jgi:hypothetical protein
MVIKSTDGTYPILRRGVIHLWVVVAAVTSGVLVAGLGSALKDSLSVLLIGIGLVIQAAAVTLVFSHLGRGALTRAGAVLILLAATFHGLNELLLWMFPGQDSYRLLVSADYVGFFVLWISVAILLLTIAYLATINRRPIAAINVDAARARIRRIFEWRLLLAASIALELLTVAGNGYRVNASTLSSPALYAVAGLASQFLVLSLALTSFAIVLRFGMRWLLPAIAVQSTAVAAVGQRWEIFVTAVLLLYALARVGLTISRGQIWVSVAAFLFFALVITSARGVAGHISTTGDASLRLDYLTAGLANLSSAETRAEIVYDLGHRLDGNSFGAMELQALDSGGQPLGFAPLWVDVTAAIPNFVNPNKSYSTVDQLVEKEYAETNLDLPLPKIGNAHQDILPTQLGATVGFWGPWGMLVIALLLGIGFGVLDNWLLSRVTTSRLAVGLALMSSALSYQGSWNAYTLNFRGLLVLLGIAWLLEARLAAPSVPRISATVIRSHTSISLGRD